MLLVSEGIECFVLLLQQLERFLAQVGELKDHDACGTIALTLDELSGFLEILKQELHLFLIDCVVMLILLAAADVFMQDMSGFEEK